jgi:hypothetical protein
MKKSTQLLRLITAIIVLALLFIPTAVLAQSDIKLNIDKIIGYGMGNKIAGTFNIAVIGPADQISSVNFMIDGQSMGQIDQAPFKMTFDTKNYSTGSHEFSAEVTLKDGSTIIVGPSQYIIPTADEQRSSTLNLVLPILGIAVVAILVTTVIPMLTSRGKVGSVEPGTARKYGMAGGAICPKCGRPTPRHTFGLNLFFGKLDRCENCGKWSLLRAVPIEVLRAAEKAELDEVKASAEAIPEKSEEDKLREMLDRSKYTD